MNCLGYTRVQQVLKDLNTFGWVWRTASPAQADLPGLHLIGSDSGMPELVRPTLEVHRSFLAAMAEFRGEGRGGVDDNSMIGLENREFGGTWDTFEASRRTCRRSVAKLTKTLRARLGGCPAPPFGTWTMRSTSDGWRSGTG